VRTDSTWAGAAAPAHRSPVGQPRRTPRGPGRWTRLADHQPFSSSRATACERRLRDESERR
jgi:hypothetical protein